MAEPTILELLKLPLTYQVSIGSGYAAYMLAYTGMRREQTAVDRAFATLVFSIVATLLLLQLRAFGVVWSSILTVFGTSAVGVLWRILISGLLTSALRAINLSWSDEHPSALSTLIHNNKHRLTQIAVLTKDDTWLMCDDADEFAKSPFGAMLIGEKGDLTLYVTDEEKKGEEPIKIASTRDNESGDQLTYVPADQIKRINLRYKTPTCFLVRVWGHLQSWVFRSSAER